MRDSPEDLRKRNNMKEVKKVNPRMVFCTTAFQAGIEDTRLILKTCPIPRITTPEINFLKSMKITPLSTAFFLLNFVRNS